jgi:hypothetical protein
MQKSPEDQQADVFLWVTLGGNWVLSARSKQYARAWDVLSAAGLLSVDHHDLVTPEFEWSNLETVIAVLRFNGISAEVAEETE